MNKRQKLMPKPVTVLQLWEKAKRKKHCTQTGPTSVILPNPSSTNGVVPAGMWLLPAIHNEHELEHVEDDDWLRLGKGVFELSGEAGSGKTQIALSLCHRTAMSTAPNAAGPTAVYLSLGPGRLPKALQRLQQMADSSRTHDPWLFRLLTKPILQRDDWTHFLREADYLFNRHRETLRLVVVDSLADLVRDDFGQFTHFDRTTWLLAWVQRCQVLADRYELTWLLVNQQATTISKSGVWESKPALGLAWAHAVQASWICHRSVAGQARRLVLHKSSRFPVGQTAHFTVQNSGVLRVQNKLL